MSKQESKSFEIKLANGKVDSFDTGYQVWTFFERMSSKSVSHDYEYIVPNLTKSEEHYLNSVASKFKSEQKEKGSK